MYSLEPLEPRLLCATSKTLFIVGRTFAADASREALEIVGLRRPIDFVGCTFAGGSTSCRINDVLNVTFEDCHLAGASGLPDPDGHSIQLINCGNVRLDRCDFEATKQSEDLISVFNRKGFRNTVYISDCYFHGRGFSQSGNAICFDGPGSSDATIQDCRIVHARCGITIANGSRVVMDAVAFIRTGTGVFRHEFY